MPDKRKASKLGVDSPGKEEEATDDNEDTQEDTSVKRKSEDPKKSKAVWSASEDEALLKAVIEDQQDREAEGDGEEDEDWDEIAKSVQGKTPVQCLKRYIALNRKQEASPIGTATSPAPEKEEEEESPVSKKAKRSKKEAEPSSTKWSPDEIELLKKLVEQYKDSTFPIRAVSVRVCGQCTHCAALL